MTICEGILQKLYLQNHRTEADETDTTVHYIGLMTCHFLVGAIFSTFLWQLQK